MRYRIRLLQFLTLLVFVVSAIASTTSSASSTSEPLSIQVEESSLLVPTRVSYEWTKKGLKVKGRIAKTRSRYGRILGHAEIELLDAQGRVLVRNAAALQGFSPRRKDPDRASFQALIESVPAGAATLRVRHAKGSWH
jgi:hypothetical protein